MTPAPTPLEAVPETLRLHQANERTMLAWVRTGIALMGFGFAIARFGLFLRQLAAAATRGAEVAHNPMGGTVIGVVLVLLGMSANVAATLRYRYVRAAIERGQLGAPSGSLVYVLGGVASACGLVLALLLADALLE